VLEPLAFMHGVGADEFHVPEIPRRKPARRDEREGGARRPHETHGRTRAVGANAQQPAANIERQQRSKVKKAANPLENMRRKWRAPECAGKLNVERHADAAQAKADADHQETIDRAVDCERPTVRRRALRRLDDNASRFDRGYRRRRTWREFTSRGLLNGEGRRQITELDSTRKTLFLFSFAALPSAPSRCHAALDEALCRRASWVEIAV
jgi:hypothetical protein